MTRKILLFTLFVVLAVIQSNAQREFKTQEGDTTYVMKRYDWWAAKGSKLP